MLGKFLELSVHAPDILESLGFYKSIGFTELETGDVWPHGYAVVSDGDICIGLHDLVFDSPALTFVQQDLVDKSSLLICEFVFFCGHSNSLLSPRAGHDGHEKAFFRLISIREISKKKPGN